MGLKEKNKIKMKKVRFSDDPSETEIVLIMAYIPSLLEISPSTRKSIWWDRSEVSSIMYHSRKSINDLRKWMRQQCTHRGLENYCSIYYESKREQDEHRYRNAIFNEQRKQRKLSSSNTLSIEQNECIHQIAIKYSRVSVCF